MRAKERRVKAEATAEKRVANLHKMMKKNLMTRKNKKKMMKWTTVMVQNYYTLKHPSLRMSRYDSSYPLSVAALITV